MNNVLIYSEDISGVEYSDTHPFKPSRARQMVELLNRYQLLNEDNQEICEPEPLDEEQLLLYHTEEYIRALRDCEQGEFDVKCLEFGIGTSDNPVFHGLYDFALTASGGTSIAARKIMNGEARFAFNILGGFHHALSDMASGFCYINDLVIAIKELLGQFERAVYIDIDVHHGDGVQEAFYGNERVLTISLHESGYTLFPGTGFEHETGEGRGAGYSVNVPLLTGSDDEVYTRVFDRIVPPLLEAYRPEVTVLQIGGDTHRDDPLANLNLTSNAYEKVLKTVNNLSERIIATGGGGYNLYKTSSLWAMAWSTICGVEPFDLFAGSVGGMMYGPETESGSLRDEPFELTGFRKKKCLEESDRVAKYIEENVFPVHGIKH